MFLTGTTVYWKMTRTYSDYGGDIFRIFSAIHLGTDNCGTLVSAFDHCLGHKNRSCILVKYKRWFFFFCRIQDFYRVFIRGIFFLQFLFDRHFSSMTTLGDRQVNIRRTCVRPTTTYSRARTGWQIGYKSKAAAAVQALTDSVLSALPMINDRLTGRRLDRAGPPL